MYKVAWVGQEEVEKVFEEEPGPVVWYSSVSVGLEWRERGGRRGKRFGQVCFEGRRETETRGGGGWWGKREEGMGGKYPKVMKQEWDGETERGGVERMWKRTELQCGSFLTCPTHWISRGGGENLWGKVFKGHDLSMVLNNGLQVECPLLIAGKVLLRESTQW